ncbi:hypothetical protein GCM10023149_00940 [Mucilaginibacter gynuensis]|uniref:DUF4296 domain-containing protein n=2 Tax=Mucilaginibacter gynuensis TaxID=1302236 RepID=A0ABP8FMX9_9SPHI
MVNLLVDIHIVDGSISELIQMPDTLYKYGTAKYLDLFKRYDTDSAQFNKSFRYYSSNPKEFAVMYDTIVNRLKVQTDVLTKKFEKQRAAEQKKMLEEQKKSNAKKAGPTSVQLDSIKKADSTKAAALKGRPTSILLLKERLKKLKAAKAAKKIKDSTKKNALPR